MGLDARKGCKHCSVLSCYGSNTGGEQRMGLDARKPQTNPSQLQRLARILKFYMVQV